MHVTSTIDHHVSILLGMDVGELFARDIRANFETDGDLRSAQKTIYFLILNDEIVCKTGKVVRI